MVGQQPPAERDACGACVLFTNGACRVEGDIQAMNIAQEGLTAYPDPIMRRFSPGEIKALALRRMTSTAIPADCPSGFAPPTKRSS